MQRAFLVWLTKQAHRSILRSKRCAFHHASFSSTSGSELRRVLLDERRFQVQRRPSTVKVCLPCDLRVTAIDVQDPDTVAVSLFARHHDDPAKAKLLLEEGADYLSLSLTGGPMSNEDLPHRLLCTVELPARLSEFLVIFHSRRDGDNQRLAVYVCLRQSARPTDAIRFQLCKLNSPALLVVSWKTRSLIASWSEARPGTFICVASRCVSNKNNSWCSCASAV